MQKSRPARAVERGRVSPTAPEAKSVSAAIWRHLESIPGMNERLERGKAQLAAGQRVRFEDTDETR